MSVISRGEVVIIDDDEDLLNSLEDYLTINQYSVRKSTDADGCLALFEDSPPDMAVIDLGLQDAKKDGIWLLEELRKKEPDVPVVVLSGYARLDVGVSAMRVGAFDFIEKPIVPRYFLEIIRRKIKRRLCAAIRRTNEIKITGRSAAATALSNALEEQAEQTCRLMLLGPIGAGKEYAARCMHQMSLRRAHPFVVVRCRGTSVELFESQMFGEARPKGQHIPGLFEQAEGGTIYLDEVCALSEEVQQKLVSFLVRGKYELPNGKSFVSGDSRVVSGSCENITKRIADGRLRKDLYERLSIAEVIVPPLDIRKEDIPALCDSFVSHYYTCNGLRRREFTTEAMNILQTTDWPGNIRQLRNLVENLLIKDNSGHPVSADDLRGGNALPESALSSGKMEKFWNMNIRDARNEFERQYLVTQINRHGGNVTAACAAIGMERTAVQRKLKGLNVGSEYHAGTRVVVAKAD